MVVTLFSVTAAGAMARMLLSRAGRRRGGATSGLATIAVVLSTNIFGVIALASKAFALCCMLQFLATAAEVRSREGVTAHTVWFPALALGVPAE